MILHSHVSVRFMMSPTRKLLSCSKHLGEYRKDESEFNRAALILSLRSVEAERPRTLKKSEFLQATTIKKRGELAIRQSRLQAARSQLGCRLTALQ
ncbi:hypothetical protein Pst134EA_005278 [Puccinia striiformis f. sp. tritici]|nr:uncharacterized protein Pst134EA_031310 [Puccinia striiformis f. sp. tritici]XP_047810831.1 hypothetical protein Pst134EA_005278 [Puccinia striiformis f. sp. tritici]KAH9445364.1 hypothetical protein Pst134EA_031310 [Puccinia striiformis f. sp. tritici]KAH9471377.1 hypothetical protein Pst134EA_005278 [Puccinia striiformis f. sp. tritici]